MTKRTDEWIGCVEKVHRYYQFANITLPHTDLRIRCSDLETYNKLKKILKEFSKKEWGCDGGM